VLDFRQPFSIFRFLHNAPRCQPARRELTRGVTLAAAGEPNHTKRLEYLQQVIFKNNFLPIIYLDF